MAGDKPQTILGWYDSRRPRWIDLVGDYAGKELFLIEGDSLLRHCFEDERLDFDDGFQLLHAVWTVEQFLEGLVKRYCNFHVAFFDDNCMLCIPQGIKEPVKSKYLLARSVLIRHLTSHLPDIQIHSFSSLLSDEFDKYLNIKPVHFIMAHDGALPSGATEVTEVDKTSRTLLRENIWQINQKGLNVALINLAEFRDAKVFTFILEGTHHNADDQHLRKQIQPARNEERLTISHDVELSSDFVDKVKHRMVKNDSENDTASASELLAAAVFSAIPKPSDLLTSAFTLHLLLSKHLSLSQRRLQLITFDEVLENEIANFLNDFSLVGDKVLRNRKFVDLLASTGATSNLHDSVDGRLFRGVISAMLKDKVAQELPNRLNEEFKSTSLLVAGQMLSLTPDHDDGYSVSDIGTPGVELEGADNIAVMPFSNSVFDPHLECIHVATAENSLPSQMASMKLYRETTHWHNRAPLVTKQAPEVKYSKWHNPLRTNQRYMAEMTAYAASLTGAKGKALTPETIIVGQKLVELPITEESIAPPVPKKSAKKGPQTLSKKDQIIAANKEKKGGAQTDKAIEGWERARQNYDELSSDQDRYLKAQAYLDSLSSQSAAHVELDIYAYMIQQLLLRWQRYCKADRKDDGYYVVALTWTTIRNICASKAPLSKEVYTLVEKTCAILGIHDAMSGLGKPTTEQKLSFKFKYPAGQENLKIDMPQKEFQLMHCGPYMDRNLDAKADPRVSSFTPDGWQRKVLDEIDANNSVFVVAPTSAGKTFISFYCGEKVLRNDDDGVLVYVAPTKALVNQIAAEVQGRFSKKYPRAGKSVWAIHTRDYRVNNSTGCQILVTVPHILQIMLLSPTNAKSWAPRVRRIIFDEIHSIGNAEDGVVWEQLILAAPCPIVALSATVGNPEQFADWLSSSAAASGIKLSMIQHTTRYSDLRKYFYTPPKTFKFEGFETPKGVGLGLDGLTGLTYFHPVASLVDKTRGMPDDLSLEPRDCFLLWKAMRKAQTSKYPVPESLDPAKALPTVIRKIEIFAWEKALKEVLKKWMADRDSPFDAVVKELSPRVPDNAQLSIKNGEDLPSDKSDLVDPNNLRSTTLPLLVQLRQRHALPAILFNYDRNGCEDIASALMEQLKAAEDQYKEGKEWSRKIEAWEKWKEAEAKKRGKRAPKVSKKKTGGDDDEGGSSKADQLKDNASVETSPWDLFDPEAPQDAYSFADRRKCQPSELERYIRQLRWKNVPEFLIKLLERGIGVHHAGMNRKYRTSIEVLFRSGFLKVVIATGTLALGINMPCATVVFSGDSVFLTALNFRQAAGRGGRRGYDLIGNVVFQGITQDRASRLLSSRLPDLTGHFPLTVTLVLRLFTLLHDSKNSAYAVKAIDSLLSQPRLFLGGESFREQVLHHLRFSIEYLRRQSLLGPAGQPVNWTSCVSHLYFTENSAFAFHALLKDGYFTRLCADINTKESSILREMVLTLSHLFGRQVCREVDEGSEMAEIIHRSPSIVFLPPIPKDANIILRKHNKNTLAIFTGYVKTFAEQHVKDEERALPLSKVEVGGYSKSTTNGLNGDNKSSSESAAISALEFLPTMSRPAARSPFVALSGHGDDFKTIEDLCSSTRSGVFLEAAVIPHLELHPDESRTPLNAYIYDFFMHGALQPLEDANGIRKSDIWFLLNDFSLVLATITTSLANYLGMGKGQDENEMLDVMGGGDAAENDKDEEEAAIATALPGGAPATSQPFAAPIPPAAVKKPRKKVVDDWDEAEDQLVEQDKVEAEFVGVNAESEDEEYAKLMKVYVAFVRLKKEFDGKFREIFA